jgi:hypothetical protein
MSLWMTKAALILSFAVLSLPTFAPAAEITLRVEVGYHGVFQLGRPFPIKIEIANTGPPVEGTIEAMVWKGGATKGSGAFAVHHQRRVLVGAAARKSATFTIDPGSVSRPLTVSFHGPRFTVTQEVDLRRHFVPSAVVLLLTESDFTVLPGLSRASNPLVAVAPEELPSDSRAYSGVATVVLYEPSLRELSTAQSSALETWVAGGGKLVALGSLHYSLYQEPALGRFLPVKISGLKNFTTLPELEKRYGAPLGPIQAQDAKLLDGTSVVEEKGSPIVVEAARGKGKIVYLALDIGRPPLSRWDGLGALFRDLAAPSAEAPSAAPAAWDDAVFSQLLVNRAVSSIYLPAGAFAGGIIAYLVGLGLLTWLWERGRLVPRTLGMAFTALVAFASLGGYFYFIRGGRIPDGVLVTSTLLEAIAGGEVEASSNAALFSTLRRDYDVVVEKGWTDFEPLARRAVAAAEENSITIEEEGGRPRLRMPLKAWDYRLFRLRSVARLPIEVELDRQASRRVLKIVNRSAQDLTDCWVIIAGQSAALGDIPSGASRVREFPVADEPIPGGGRAPRAGLRDVHFKDPVRELLLRTSYFPQEQTSAWTGTAMFFGWVQGAPRGLAVDGGKVLARDYAFFRVALPLGDEEE